MVRTPWGDADELRGRRLPPGRGTAAAEVERNQRERLYGATVAVVASKGYAETAVADLLEVSGVSRTTFYRYFDDKCDCFLATLEEILGAATAVTASRLRRQGSWEERARQAVAALVALVVDQPAAARICLVEAYAAGPEAMRRVDEGLAGFQALARDLFEDLPERERLPAEMSQALVAGLRKIIHTRLRRGKEAELVGLVDELLTFGLSYRPPPRPLRTPRRPVAETAAAPEPAGDAAERLVRATTTVVARRGYPETTLAEIVAVAGVSFSTFYVHFDGKAEAFEAALYSGRARMLGIVLPAYKRARSWPEAVRAMMEAAFAYLEAEPDFARLIAVEAYAAGAEALEQRDLGVEAAARFLDDGAAEYATSLQPIVREGIVSVLYGLLCERVGREGAGGLRDLAPLATYLTLLPFLGAEEAANVASGGVAAAATAGPS